MWWRRRKDARRDSALAGGWACVPVDDAATDPMPEHGAWAVAAQEVSRVAVELVEDGSPAAIAPQTVVGRPAGTEGSAVSDSSAVDTVGEGSVAVDSFTALKNLAASDTSTSSNESTAFVAPMEIDGSVALGMPDGTISSKVPGASSPAVPFVPASVSAPVQARAALSSPVPAPVAASPIVLVGACTDRGMRPANQDAYVIGSTSWAVADGIGGGSFGDAASCVAAQAAVGAMEDGIDPARALTVAHRRVRELKHLLRTEDTGTTLVAAWRQGGELTFASAGDTRVYAVECSAGGELAPGATPPRLMPLTTHGRLQEDMNVLAASLGYGEPPVPELVQLPIAGERQAVLVCTDGVWETFARAKTAAEVTRILAEETAAPRAAHRIVRAALAAGADDNVTALVLIVQPAPGLDAVS